MVKKIKKNPREFVAQPLEILSTIPTICENGIEPKTFRFKAFYINRQNFLCYNWRPYKSCFEKGSTIVNSSQGGGSKETMVVDA